MSRTLAMLTFACVGEGTSRDSHDCLDLMNGYALMDYNNGICGKDEREAMGASWRKQVTGCISLHAV